MSFADVLAKTTFMGFSAADEMAVRNAMETAYNGSPTARDMFDDWIAVAGNTISVQFSANDFKALPNTGIIQIDPSVLDDVNYIDDNGEAIEYSLIAAVTHEFVHALTGRTDDIGVIDYAGDTVVFTNQIHQELGIPDRNSYIGTNTDAILTPGFQYTNGTAIDRSVARDSDWNSSALFSYDDLLVGGPSANTLESGLGDDFLFGAGGDDVLNGGLFGTDTAVLTGKPVDYDIRLNADGTWTSRHVRGTSDEDTDTFQNLERVQFEGGQIFNLAQGGLTFQNDFAFVIDQTGSMFDDIAAVKSVATDVVNALFADNTIDARVGVVGFRDNTIGEPTSVLLPFTDQDIFAARQTAAVNAINAITVGGGGDFPETSFDGLLKALDGSMGDWRIGAGTKKVALFTDAASKDAFLLPTVLGLTSDIGATINTSSSLALGTFGSVDTFELSFDAGEGAGLYPETNPVDLPDFVPSDDIIQPPGGTATVQITTIFVETFTSPDPDLREISEASGGSVLTAANPAEVVDRLLEVVTAANYVLTLDNAMVSEGDNGTTEVNFLLSRDRTGEGSVVTLDTTGSADAADVTGAATSVSFAVGESSKAITVSVVGDTIDEGDETFGLKIVDITEPSSFSGTPVEFTIKDDDAPSKTQIVGTAGRETLVGTESDDLIQGLGGLLDVITTGTGADDVDFMGLKDNGSRDVTRILDYAPGEDRLLGVNEDDVARAVAQGGTTTLFLEGDDRDQIMVTGTDSLADIIFIA